MGDMNRVGIGLSYRPDSAEIFNNLVGIGLSYRLARARMFKLLRSPGTDSKESIAPAVLEFLNNLWGLETE
jgi:hypothetical protein